MWNRFDLFPSLVRSFDSSVCLKLTFRFSSQQRCTPEENPFELIHGKECLYETYLDKQFRITPESFLQVNKQAAELLFQSTLKQAELDQNTILLDIGSGIGVHSIMASPLVKKIYAIDPLPSSLENGKFNAQLNNCSENIEWMGAFAEANLHRILKKVGDLHGDNSRIVAIVNPSRYSLSESMSDSDWRSTVFDLLSQQNHCRTSKSSGDGTSLVHSEQSRWTSDAHLLRVCATTSSISSKGMFAF